LTGSVPLQLDAIDNMNIEMEGNKFSDLSYKFCDNDGWMNGAVSFFECDAIMCPPHTYSQFGRQNSTDSACQYCDKNSDSSPYWGSVSCDVVVDEKEILKILYNRRGGANWYRKDNWMTSKDICTWYGIECRDTKSVQAIRLGANNLIGTPPHEIFGMKQLHTLWLHSNPIDFKFSGIEKAQNLVELRLDSTGLSDLYGLANAKSLVKLNLKYNRIAGDFPQEIFQLDNLEELELTDNL
jgi:Leucine-rich repeat (LRR) protein